MRRALLLAAVLLAGCSQVAEPGAMDGPDAGDAVLFHTVETLPEGSYHCAGCHYGVAPVWDARWEPDGDGWALLVEPAFPGVELLVVDAAAGRAPLVHDSGFLVREDFNGTWRHAFDVPADAASLFVSFHTEPRALTPRGGPSGPRDVETRLVLERPDGHRFSVEGPERELRQVVVPDPMPGRWAFVGSTVEPPSGPLAGRATVEVGSGQAAVPRDGPARFWFAGDLPPPVSLAVRPYHDHYAFETGDWDYADSFRYTSELAVRLGPEPAPYAWTEAVLDRFWEAPERELERRASTFALAYEEDGDSNRDGPVGTSAPHYSTRSPPIPPGTARLRFEATWAPPVEEPRLGVRFGPAVTPHYQEAEATGRGAGHATFEADVAPEWWDVVFEDGEPRLAGEGTMDFAPYLDGEDGETVLASIQVDWTVWVVRGPAPGGG